MGPMCWRKIAVFLVVLSHYVFAYAEPAGEPSKHTISPLSSLSDVSAADFSSMLTDAELAWLVANPVVTVGPDPYFHPIEFFDERGNYQGLAADYLTLIANRTGITFQIEQRDSWQQVVEEVQSGGIDMMAANVPSNENTQYLNFTDNYFSFPNVLVTSEFSLAAVVSLSEMAGRTVAVVAGYPDEEYLKEQYPEIERIRVDSVVKGLEAVANKQADALLSFLPTVSYFMEQEGFSGLQITSVRVRFGGAFAVKKQWPELISILDKALSTISPQERNDIVRRWVTFQEEVDSVSLTDAEIRWLEGISEVRLGIDNSWAPFEYRDALGAYKAYRRTIFTIFPSG
ncbi:transporter substrate-binding domain-containing protein [Vibrio variabilis]|uniref:transporter substrate-binding domain-containing protein n=1 Tax=Vibrio variabilis TaxID=990271 RepID=UPI000DD552F9|nr:transporter substrate-binding domain-containing protein [Vibrio variabilis]